MNDPTRLRRAHETARDQLLAARNADGYWVGELSSSALSTATAASALVLVDRHTPGASDHSPLIDGALQWLARCQNADGGWGDTDKSHSNISTTMLVRAAFHLAGAHTAHEAMLASAERYIETRGGVSGLRKRYGRDKTFAVPILTNCALAGLVPWSEVSPLPFELAALPQSVFRFLGLPVVSYAIPALVAIGLARYVHRKPRNPLTRLVRRLAIGRSLKTLGRMQPTSGGFLEATPLTSFVVMSLAGSGRADHPVVHRGVEFLVDSVRPDGSWPIDTNLATWVTSLAVNALSDTRCTATFDWLLSCQHRQPHPFTGAAPGGWGWTDKSGAVPDADDTPGALLALAAMRDSADQRQKATLDTAAIAGIGWLLDLQNRDGGWPTFCRGWGKLPFDRSGVDLTAHALRAFFVWKNIAQTPLVKRTVRRLDSATRRGLAFLAKHQRPDGSWVPLWFGNQDHPLEENPVYGTARVLLAYRDLGLCDSQPARSGLRWLVDHRNPDGGWGGKNPDAPGASAAQVSSVEETAVATEALISTGNDPLARAAAESGVAWLIGGVEAEMYQESSPIGFYFAKLWYYERLYPLIFTVAALGHAVDRSRWEPSARTTPTSVGKPENTA